MNKEQIKEEFLKSYNCTSLEQFKKKMLTSEKFYGIMEDYFTKCSYNQKYKEVIDRAIEYISELDDNTDDTTCYDIDKYTRDYILSILKEVE